MTGRSHLDDCVHCGFCLPSCPTWISWGKEADSPRGRIDLVRAARDGRIAFDGEVALHLDRCLGCFACLPACPSGVRYDRIIEEARAAREKTVQRSFTDRLFRALIFSVFPYPARLRVAAAALAVLRFTGIYWLLTKSRILHRFSPRLAAAFLLAPRVGLRTLDPRSQKLVPPNGPRRLRVGLLRGCVQRVFFPGVNEATVRVLSAEGCEVVSPEGQGCCGALSVHAGRIDESRHMVRTLIERFEKLEVEVVVVNSAGCGSHLKECERLFVGDPFEERARAFSTKVRDVSELLASLPPRSERHPLCARVAYHSPCHLGHGQNAGAFPRALLKAIPGFELIEIPRGEECCGSAGIYNLVEPRSADEIGARKVDAVLLTHASWLASPNPGCTLHIQRLLRERGAVIRARHPIEFLDASIRGLTGPEDRGDS